MNSETERLLEVLEQELEAYEELEGMILSERESFRHPEAEKIEELLGVKAQVVTRIHQLEQERRQITSAIVSAQGLDGENIRLLEMLRDLPAPWAGRLKEVRERLLAKVTKVNKENDWNRRYIGDLLTVVNGVVDSVRSAFAEPPVYGERGKLGENRVNGGEVFSQAV